MGVRIALGLTALVLGLSLVLPAAADALAEGGVAAEPAAIAAPPGAGPAAGAPLPPFGHQLFGGAFSGERTDGLSPDYAIKPGDQIAVRLWGALMVDVTATVDAQGNVFIPDVGPVRVAGVRNDQLNQRVAERVRATFVETVEVYTNLLGTQPVAVFVTGAVVAPGMYAGVATDSVLFYLDRAGGIDPDRGSFRRLQVLRAGGLLAAIDLYPFLLEGRLPPIQLVDGDTIVVAPRGPSVGVDGMVANRVRFEFVEPIISGQRLLDLARPRPAASHATVRGVRDGAPYAAYETLTALGKLELRDGDQVRIEPGLVAGTLVVRVEGEHLGPSAFTVPAGTLLMAVLDRVAVDPARANLAAIHLRRRSIAERQKRALDQSLDRLEASVLGAPSASIGVAEIRTREADLIGQFVVQARQMIPEGRLALAQPGGLADVRLEPDDVIVIPARTDVVLVNGEVNFPRAVVHRPGTTVADYVALAGGFTERGNQERLVVRRANGEIALGDQLDVLPGDEIRVMPKVEGKSFQIAKDVVEMIYQAAFAIGVPLRVLF